MYYVIIIGFIVIGVLISLLADNNTSDDTLISETYRPNFRRSYEISQESLQGNGPLYDLIMKITGDKVPVSGGMGTSYEDAIEILIGKNKDFSTLSDEEKLYYDHVGVRLEYQLSAFILSQQYDEPISYKREKQTLSDHNGKTYDILEFSIYGVKDDGNVDETHKLNSVVLYFDISAFQGEN